jgi:hypothetical protein
MLQLGGVTGDLVNANFHFHTLALDGVFSEGHGDALAFHPAPVPRADEVAAALATVRYWVRRLLVRVTQPHSFGDYSKGWP